MQSYTRRQLKHDKFVEATSESLHWASDHRRNLLIGIIAIAVVAGAIAGGTYYRDQREIQASAALASAMKTYSAPVAPAGQAPEGMQTFPTDADRGKAATAAFADVAAKWGSTPAGQYAQYMEGVTALEMGDNANGEAQLKKAADSSNKSVKSLAKFALASFYRATARESDAIALYKQVIDANTDAVPANTARYELAGLYEDKKDKKDAVKLYEEIEKNTDKSSPVFDMADKKMKALTASSAGAPPTAATASAPAK